MPEKYHEPVLLMNDYKAIILDELEKAVDVKQVEKIINRSVAQLPEDDLYRHLEIIYLHLLQNGLEKLSEKNFDAVKWRNICHALHYLKQMNDNRSKADQ